MASQIKLRRDTAANWTAANPVLGAGEPGYDTTNGKLKIGNGTTAWNSLSYFDDKVTDFSAVAADILPDTDNTRDLGSPAKQWRHVYMSGGSIYLDNIKLTNNDGKLEITKVINPGEENEAPDPVDSNAGDSVTSKLTNGEHTFELMDDGSLELDGDPFTGGGGSTGQWAFNGDTAYNNTGNGLYIQPGQGNDDGSIYIPTTEEGGDLTISNNSGGNIELSAGNKSWQFNTNGDLQLPNGGDIKDSNGDSVLGGSGAVVERSIEFPNGESGDTRGTIALTPNGETYICTEDWEDAATALQGTFSALTVELYDIGQSGGVFNSAVLSIADEPEIYNILRYGSWSEGQFTINAGVTWGGAKNVTSTSYNDPAGLMYISWLVSPGDPQEIPLGTSVTVVYTGGGTQTPIWKKLVDLVSGGEGSGVGAIGWRSEGDLTIETLRPIGYNGDCDLNLYAADDVFITANGDEVSIQANTNVVIESDDGNHAWTFAQDGSLQLPSLNNTGYENGYGLDGPTLRLGGENDPNDQVIITGPTPNQNVPSAQRLVIQGQRGYGDWNQPAAGEGGDVYIWGGVGGEGSNNGNYYGGSGGDIKIRGGQGQNNEGGYVKIEGGDAADWNNTGSTGGYIEISAGDGLYSNANGGDVNIRGGRANSGGTGNNGNVNIRTGVNSEYEWQFDNGGNLTLPTGIATNVQADDLTIKTNDGDLTLESDSDVFVKSSGGGHTWTFGVGGNLTLPAGGDIVDSSGNSVLGAAVDTNIWVETFASDTVGDNVTSATSVEYDLDGNVIALFSHDDTNNSNRYISVAKFDTSGNKLWQQRFAAAQYSDGWGLAADSTAIYVAGELEGTGSPAAYQVSSLMKLNTANGNVIWMKSYDFGDASYSQVVDVASDGNPVMVGYAYSGGQSFVATTKVDKDTGNIIWSRKLDGQNGEYTYGMAVGPAGEIVVIGYMDNLGILNTAATLYSDPVSNANWTQNTGITAGALTAAVTFTDGVPNFTSIVDGSGGRSVDDVIGTFNGTGFGGASPADDMTVKVGTVTPGDNSDRMLVVKYDSSGSIQWQKAIQYDAGFDCSGADADIDADGNIYVCGQYWKDNGAGGTTSAMSLLKMDGNGAKQWSRRTEGDCQDLATSVVVGPDNCLYLSGITGSAGSSDYTFVVAKFTPLGSVVWQRLLDNTTTWTFGSGWFSNNGGSNIAVKSGYVAVSGSYGDPGPNPETAFIAQISSSGSLFTTGDWDFKGASFSGLLNNTASDITVTAAGKTDSDNAINITIASATPSTDASNFLVPTKYVLSTPIGDLTVVGNKLQGTGTNDGFQGLNLAPGPNLAADMYFRIHGGDNPTHLHLSVGDTATYDQYFGDDWKYLKLGANGVISIGTNSNTWTFGTDGNLALPGAVVNSTTPKTGGSGGTFTELDLTKSINKLTNGDYSLANGVEGQVMYLVMQDGATPSSIGVVVANFRIGGTVGSSGLLVPFKTFNDANVSYFDSRGFCTLIFTDGAWQQSGGSWD